MINRILRSFQLALRNFRGNMLHTLLSILGVVIGVAALVAILSLIDGLEKMAHERIASQTSVEMVSLRMNKYELVDGVRVAKDHFQSISYEQFLELKEQLPVREAFMIVNGSALLIKNDSVRMGLTTYATSQSSDKTSLFKGRMISADAFAKGIPEAVVSYPAAKRWYPDSPEMMLDDTLSIHGNELIVVGILDSTMEKALAVAYPITLPTDGADSPIPALIFKAESVEKVPELENQINTWLDAKYPERDPSDFTILTDEKWVKQLNQGFMVFRIVMGMIIGISVLVGGIGIMNVLLISVNERVKEIGIRKATGAKRRDIVWQFLAESITISVFGSFIGTLVGVGFAMLVVPIARMLVDVPFQATFTTNTLLVTSVIAILIGVIFGTYPALRASRLDPVEAIRKE
jgi:putative ABC transport system permease protein